MWKLASKASSRRFERMLRWLTISTLRSTSIFIILTFTPILLLTYYIVASNIRATKTDAARADLQARDFVVQLLHADLRNEIEIITTTAEELTLQNALPSAAGKPASGANRALAETRLRVLAHRLSDFDSFALVTPDGTPQAAAPDSAELSPSYSGPQPKWFADALGGRVTVSPLIAPAIAASTADTHAPGSAVFAIAAPVGDHGVRGVLVGTLPEGVVADWVRHSNVTGDQYLYVFDSNRQVISAPSSGPMAADGAAALPAVGAALAGQSGRSEFVSPSLFETNYVAFAPLPDYGLAVLIVRPVRFGFYFVQVFYDKLAMIALIVFTLAVVSGLLLRAAFRYYQDYNREVESGRSKTEALLGSIGDGVVAVDGEGKIIEFNRAAAALIHVPASQALHRSYRDVLQLGDERAQPVRDRSGAPAPQVDPVGQAMQQNRPLRMLRDLVLLCRDGSRVPVTVSAAPLQDERGEAQGCIAVISDASQEREVDRMKNEFISIASHQLRTPMSGVKGVLSLMLEEVLGPLNAEQRAYLRRAYDSNERLIALVSDLLNISRLEQGQLQMREEPVDLMEVVKNVTAEFQGGAARYHQTLRFSPPSPEPAPGETVLLGDPVRLREVFVNLLDNAVKYTPENGEITVYLHLLADRFEVDVSDSGVGIPADKLSHLFQRFSRIQNPLSGREFGTGLGLYFARSVVELHRGHIEVESEVGRGTTFRVSLPRPGPAVAPVVQMQSVKSA